MSKGPRAGRNKAKDTEDHPVKLSLSIKERLEIGSILPERADIITQILSRDIAKRVQFTQAEAKKMGIKKTPQGGLAWNKGSNTDIIFSEAEMTLMRTQIDRLDRENKVTSDVLSLCLKIREGGK